MPEGDTLYVVAERLRPYLVGQSLTHVAVRLGRAKRFGPPKGPLRAVTRLEGQRVDAVVPKGKHLILEMGRFALRVHLGMSGSWHRYPVGGRWRDKRVRVGALLRTASDELVCFGPPTVALGRRQDILAELLHLGPDLLVDPVDWDRILANTRVNPEAAVADILLDQRVAAGVGNVYKNEVLFLERLHPSRPVSSLTDDQIRHMWQLASRLMRDNLSGEMRSTTGLSGAQRTHVYGMLGQPCPSCSTSLEFTRHGAQARATWWCPACQT